MQTKSAMCSQGGGLAQLAGMGGMQDLAEEDDEAASATKKELQNLHISLLNNLTGMSMYTQRPFHSCCRRIHHYGKAHNTTSNFGSWPSLFPIFPN